MLWKTRCVVLKQVDAYHSTVFVLRFFGVSVQGRAQPPEDDGRQLRGNLEPLSFQRLYYTAGGVRYILYVVCCICDARAGLSYHLSGRGLTNGHSAPLPPARIPRYEEAVTHELPTPLMTSSSCLRFSNFRPPPAQLFATSLGFTNDLAGLTEGQDQGEQGEDQAEQAAAVASGKRGRGGGNVMAWLLLDVFSVNKALLFCCLLHVNMHK